MQRLERAGWRRIRQDGAHFTYEREGKRITYHYGRPQTELGKVKLKEEMRRFDLVRIEAAMEAARKTQSAIAAQQAVDRANTRLEAARAASEPHLNGELSYQEMHILFAQLHRDHKIRVTDIGEATGIGHSALHEYIHLQKPTLNKAELAALRDWFLEREVRLNLTRDRSELLKRGYGVRAGSITKRDNRLSVIAVALAATGEKQVDLNYKIFGKRTTGIVGAVINNEVKRVTPKSMERLEAWYKAYTHPLAEAPKPVIREETTPAAHGYGVKSQDELKELVESFGPNAARRAMGMQDAPDWESVAVKAVWEAIKDLDAKAQARVLNYNLSRVRDEEG